MVTCSIPVLLQIKTEQCDLWIAFLRHRHRIRELQTSKKKQLWFFVSFCIVNSIYGGRHSLNRV